MKEVDNYVVASLISLC